MSNQKVSKRDWVSLEYLGRQRGSISFRVGKRLYRGGNNKLHKIILVHPDDTEALLAKNNIFKLYQSPEPPVDTEANTETSEKSSVDPAAKVAVKRKANTATPEKKNA